MKRCLFWSVAHPLWASGGIAIVTVLLVLQLPQLEIDLSVESLMAERDPARQYYAQVKQKFGSDDLTIVLVKAQDVMTAPTLRVIKRLSDALAQLEGVSRVESLTTVNNLKGEEDTLHTEPLVGAEIPSNSTALQRIRADALDNRLLVGTLVSHDAKAAAIVVYTDAVAGDKQFYKGFVDRVEALIAQESTPGLTIYQMGSPFIKVTLGDFIAHDQRTLIPLSLLVLFVCLFLISGTLQGVMIPFITSALSTCWGVGLMVLCGIPINALTSFVPSLLIIIGFTEDVHMIAEYAHLRESGQEKLLALRTMLEQTALPVLVTTSTTVLGFLSLLTTDISALIQFGYAASLGLTANFVVTMSVLPLMLKYWRVPQRMHSDAGVDSSTPGLIPRLMVWLAETVLRYRFPILIVAGLLTLGSLVGWYSLRVNTDVIAYFPEHSVLRQRLQDLHLSLAGSAIFYVVVETGWPDGVKQPEVLKKIAALQDFLAHTGKVDTTLSLADYLRKMHREIHGGDPAYEVIPDTPEEVAQYLLLFEGKELAKYIDFQAATANIVVRHNLTGSWELSSLLKQLEAYIAQHFPSSLHVRCTGEAILVNNTADYMAINELTGFVSTLVIIGLIHSLLFMSLWAGFLSLLPNVVPVLFNFGLMGLLGIPLNLATAMVASIAIGIAVDDTVHHMMTYNQQLNASYDSKTAIVNTLQVEGRPIIYVSLALAAGFLVLVFSNFVPSVYFGALSAFVILAALVGELVLTPILMYSTHLVALWDMLLLKMNPTTVRTAPIFRDFSQWEARKLVLMGTLKALQAGEYIIHKGAAGAEMYMVVTGRVRVFDTEPDGQEQTLTRLEPGAIFGEVAWLSQGVRTANVVAEMPTEVLQLDFQALNRLRKRFPFTGTKFFRNLASILSERLIELTAALMHTTAAAASAPSRGAGAPRSTPAPDSQG
jgi:predicted RND superfamily exporter protein/CRP-like cAMP-binding protein